MRANAAGGRRWRVDAMLVAALSLGAGALPVAAQRPAGQASNPWPALLDADVRAAADAVLRVYPAAVDPRNPGWRTLFDEAVARATRQAREVSSFGGYAAVMPRAASSHRTRRCGQL